MSFELKLFLCRHVSIWGFWNCFQKRSKLDFDLCWFATITPVSSISVIIRYCYSSSYVFFYCNNWYINGNSIYSSNYYINRKVFTSATAWKPKNLILISEKVKIEFWLVLKSWIHPRFFNFSPTLVIVLIDT